MAPWTLARLERVVEGFGAAAVRHLPVRVRQPGVAALQPLLLRGVHPPRAGAQGRVPHLQDAGQEAAAALRHDGAGAAARHGDALRRARRVGSASRGGASAHQDREDRSSSSSSSSSSSVNSASYGAGRGRERRCRAAEAGEEGADTGASGVACCQSESEGEGDDGDA